MLKFRFKKLLLTVLIIPLLLFVIFTTLLYYKQDTIVKEMVQTINNDFVGEISLKNSHISPFANFPYISIDLEEVKIYQDKNKDKAPILNLNDIYLGFDLWTLISGKFDIKSLKLKDGYINIIQDKNGEFNITKALGSNKKTNESSEALHLDLKRIVILNVDINKINEENNVILDVKISKAKSKFKTSDIQTTISLDSKFVLTLIKQGDTTIIKNKNFDIGTKLKYTNATQILDINPSEVYLEDALFKMKGNIDFDDDMNIDLKFEGAKPNFDLFIAFAPEELAPALKKYENNGNVYFDCSIKGKSINGHTPKIDANFGCSDAYFANTLNRKKLDKLQFKGHFTNGEARNTSTMEFSIKDFGARPEAGLFSGNLIVKNFDSPDIDLKLISDFELDFLAKFFNLENLKNLKGSVKLTMNFRDIIDLEHPERSIEKLNESYFTELMVKDLSFSSPQYHLALNDLDVSATVKGSEATLDYFNMKVGKSDISIKGIVSDLPAILHHTDKIVSTELSINSKYLDIFELTKTGKEGNKPINEQIENFSVKLAFKSSAKALTESPNLPIGEFFIENLYAKMKHYPHTLHDFHADVIIDEQDFRIIDFKGEIDKSDFHFSGKLYNYDLWFKEKPLGDTKIEFSLDSRLLQLQDLFAYGGENHVPEDYRHEEFRKFKVHGFTDLHFKNGLQSADIYLDQLEATMKVHPLRFEKFSGRIHLENKNLTIEKLAGKIGKSSFVANMSYYYGIDKKAKKQNNKFNLNAPYLDFDELFNYNPSPITANTKNVKHETAFNIFDIPFPDMDFYFNIKHLRYHRYMLDNFYMKCRSQVNHHLYIDTMSMKAAGGSLNIKGHFNGSDKNKIYFSPDIRLKNVDLDKLMFKFENFGQDHLVSEQLHGKLTGRLYGKILMHADMIPIINDSEIHLDVEVTKGRLENYGPMLYLSDFFKDKNLSKVLFDTLSNRIDINKGITSIPKMLINSSLGFIEISGKQDMNFNFEYYLRVPLKLITKAGVSKLLGKKTEEIDTEKEDEIATIDPNKKVKFVNIKLSGNTDNYKITLEKEKKKQLLN
jgi:hypothetical protein